MKVTTEPTTPIRWTKVRNLVLICGVLPLGSAIAVLLIGVYLSGQCVRQSQGENNIVNHQFCEWMIDLIVEKQ